MHTLSSPRFFCTKVQTDRRARLKVQPNLWKWFCLPVFPLMYAPILDSSSSLSVGDELSVGIEITTSSASLSSTIARKNLYAVKLALAICWAVSSLCSVPNTTFWVCVCALACQEFHRIFCEVLVFGPMVQDWVPLPHLSDHHLLVYFIQERLRGGCFLWRRFSLIFCCRDKAIDASAVMTRHSRHSLVSSELSLDSRDNILITAGTAHSTLKGPHLFCEWRVETGKS